MKINLKTVVTSVITIAVVLGSVFAINRFRSKDSVETTKFLKAETITEAATNVEINWNGDEFKALDNDGLLNILLIGQDRREGEDRQRSDAMILCSFNPETNRMSAISFLRDLYVQIPGYDDNRLNAAYAFGGFELIKETFNHNFGITVDGCLESDFEGFEKIIDAVGGVEIELTSEEAEIVGDGASQGTCNLNGKQAFTYARIRKIDSDFQRTDRQRKILNAVFEKAKGYQLMELAGLFSEILPMMSTDMTDDEIMTFALTLASSLAEMKIHSFCIPAEGTYKSATIKNMAVLIPDLYQIKKLIFEEYLPI